VAVATSHPQRVGKPPRHELASLHSARRGDHRVIYCTDTGGHQVEIVAIQHGRRLPAPLMRRAPAAVHGEDERTNATQQPTHTQYQAFQPPGCSTGLPTTSGMMTPKGTPTSRVAKP